ncbi:WYL domain-containing protein [Acinetobacter sp. BSP-153]|uniref:WYL domain-containing protein n=1 Tax=Acinetobacter sp. BSP-153 TaxID=3344663 RepID=UPI003770049F
MFELIAILLVVWCIYSLATGQFKPENQAKNKEELREALKKLFPQNVEKTEVDSIKKLNPRNQDYVIHYEDFKQNFSFRSITINRVYKENRHWYVDAYCHSAGEDRTFRVDRIQSMSTEKNSFNLQSTDEILSYLKKYF